jgi:uncharacterized ferritin-like protein (DUF455 family)
MSYVDTIFRFKAETA